MQIFGRKILSLIIPLYLFIFDFNVLPVLFSYSSHWCNEHYIHIKAMRKVSITIQGILYVDYRQIITCTSTCNCAVSLEVETYM